MACAAIVQIGPARQSFWALYCARRSELRERTRLLPRRGAVELTAARRHRGFPPRPGACACATAASRSICSWRNRRASRRSARTAAAGVDAQAGRRRGARHARARRRAAAADRGARGDRRHRRLPRAPHRVVVDRRRRRGARTASPLAWNLVSGVNDPPSGSERAVWVAGRRARPRRSASRRTSRASAARTARSCTSTPRPSAAASDNLLLVRSDYRAPFGSFSGTLPGGIALAHGLGVVEHHRARW